MGCFVSQCSETDGVFYYVCVCWLIGCMWQQLLCLMLFFVLIQEIIQHFGYMCVSRASSTVMEICCCL